MYLHVFLSLLLCCFSLGDHVLNLKESNFEEVIKQHPLVLIKFFAPWCGHCKNLAPEYIAAAKTLSEKTPPVTLAEVDCTVETSICSKYNVNGYPTLKIFMNGEFHSDYKGPRDAVGIANYMYSRAGPASVECQTKKDVENLLSDDKPTVVALIKSSTDSFMKNYLQLASELVDHVKFGHTHSNVIDATQDTHVQLYLPKQLRSKFEQDSYNYKGDMKISDIKEWIKNDGHGMLGYRTQSNEFFFPDSNLVVIYNNHSLENHPSGVKYLRNRVLQAIKNNITKFKNLRFAYSPSEQYSMEMSEYGFEYSAKLPAVRIFSADGKKYKLQEYSVANFIKFVEDYLSGSLASYLKSEPVSTESTSSLKHVVALNFDEIVNDPTKDVMVVFHAPWCGHCKALMPKYEKAAAQLQDEPGVLLVAMNAVANDVPKPYEVTGFPTIYFVPKSDKKNPRPYNHGREIEDIVKYIVREATDELKNFDRSGTAKKLEL